MFWQSFKYRSSLMAWCQWEKLFYLLRMLWCFTWAGSQHVCPRQFSSWHCCSRGSWSWGCWAFVVPTCSWLPLSLSWGSLGQSWPHTGLAGSSVALAVLHFCAKRSLQEACPGFHVTKLFPAAVLECFWRINNNGYFLGGFQWFLRY